MRIALSLDSGANVDAVAEAAPGTGRIVYRVLSGRLTGTFVVEPRPHADPFDANAYTALRIQFGDGPADAEPEHRLGRPVATPGDIELYGHLDMDPPGESHRAAHDALGPWPYLRRDPERYLPRGAARAARGVCLAIAAHARSHPAYPAVVADHLRAAAPDLLRLIDHRAARLRARLRAGRLELMLWEHHRAAWTAAGAEPPSPTGATSAADACADMIAALSACGLRTSVHRSGDGTAGLRVELPDGSCLLICDRRGSLPLSAAQRTGWQVHRYANGTPQQGAPEVFWSAWTPVPDSDTDALISAIAAYTEQATALQ